MARAKAPAPTLVLLVRHGQTPTTGATLPGRAPGLHLSDDGAGQAEVAAERIGALKTKVAAVYASPLERTQETAAPIARARKLRVRTERGLLECDFGEWTGGELKELASCPSGGPCSATRAGSASPAASRSPRCRRASPAPSRSSCGRAPGRDRRRRVPRRSDQGGGGGRARHPPRPVPAHRHLAVLGHRRSSTAPAGPIVLAVNSTGDDLAPAGAVMSPTR